MNHIQQFLGILLKQYFKKEQTKKGNKKISNICHNGDMLMLSTLAY